VASLSQNKRDSPLVLLYVDRQRQLRPQRPLLWCHFKISLVEQRLKGPMYRLSPIGVRFF
jgi:hypothetical protein